MIFGQNPKALLQTFQSIERFVHIRLSLELHPHKVSIETLSSGVDFLGWVHFPHHKVLRTVTKRRVHRKYSEGNKSSYQGLLSYGDTFKLGSSLDSGNY